MLPPVMQALSGSWGTGMLQGKSGNWTKTKTIPEMVLGFGLSVMSYFRVMRARVPHPPSAKDAYAAAILISLSLGLWTLWTQGKIGAFLMFNPLHNNALDFFFKAVTFLGDGIFSILLGISLIIIREKNRGAMVLAGYALSGLLAQALKAVVHAPRPMAIISPELYQYFLPGYTLNAWNSFPSGHTTSAFCFTAILAWTTTSNSFKLGLALTALLVGYSRIYLGQHFPDDVISGALLGLLAAYGVVVAWPKITRRNKGSMS
jgi:membrane-associated phospholipid phosphatase